MQIKIESKYLITDQDVKNEDLITFLNEGKEVPSTFNPEIKKIEFLVETPKGEKKYVSPNNTTMKYLIKAWGDETKNWIGKKAVVSLIMQNVKGEMKKVLYLNASDSQSKIDLNNAEEEGVIPDSDF